MARRLYLPSVHARDPGSSHVPLLLLIVVVDFALMG
jgi:hypothetical protein